MQAFDGNPCCGREACFKVFGRRDQHPLTCLFVAGLAVSVYGVVIWSSCLNYNVCPPFLYRLGQVGGDNERDACKQRQLFSFRDDPFSLKRLIAFKVPFPSPPLFRCLRAAGRLGTWSPRCSAQEEQVRQHCPSPGGRHISGPGEIKQAGSKTQVLHSNLTHC